jgi:hypothetical protein
MSAFDQLSEERVAELIGEALAGNPENSSYWGELPLFDTWSLGPVVETRESGLVDKANARALYAALEAEEGLVQGYDPETGEGDYEAVEFPHFNVGWVEHLAFRAVNEDGTPSAMLRFLYNWNAGLEDYPVASDEILWDLEAEAVEEVVSWLLPTQPEHDVHEAINMVIGWLHEHGRGGVLCVIDEGGVEVTEADVRLACLATGLSPGDEHELELPIGELVLGLGMVPEQLGGGHEDDTVYLIWEDDAMAYRAYDVAGQPTAHLLSGAAVAPFLGGNE